MAYHDLARRFKFLIASWRLHGIGHVREVFAQERVRRRYAASPPGLPPTGQFMEGFAWYRGPETFQQDFHKNSVNRIPLSAASRREFFTSLLLATESYDHILSGAELISQGKFPALGICINEPSSVFDWHRDYSSGRTWDPGLPFNRIPHVNDDGSDVKYVWELSRMYWIGWLGKAYWISNNGAWSRSFTELFDDWRARNPVNTGLNWSMPMEVAIRGFWLVMGYCMFAGAPNIPPEWWTDYLRTAFAHGTYLAGNLEYFSNLTNHYISNCFGLISLGTLFGGHPDGKRWFREGRRRLLEELDHQVTPDGVHYERSLCYHRLVLEMYLIASHLAGRCGQPFPEEAMARIGRMAEFLRDYLPPSGMAPQIGDCDDGWIMRLNFETPPGNHRDTLSLAAAVLNRPDLHAAAGSYGQSALLIAGSGPYETLDRGKTAPTRESRLYRQGGFAILHSQGLHVVAKVGPIGLHGNNDVLSFTLDTPAGPVIVDPGTYCYTRNRGLRNELRSTGAHNTPMIDGAEMAEFDGLWRVQHDATRVEIRHWSVTGGVTVLEAVHHAYDSLPDGGLSVWRRWELRGDGLEVTDRFTGSGTHRVSVRHTIPDTCSPREISPGLMELTCQDGTRIELGCSAGFHLVRGWHSTGYGLALGATCLELNEQVTAASEIRYLYRIR